MAADGLQCTVGDLKAILGEHDDDTPIVIKGQFGFLDVKGCGLVEVRYDRVTDRYMRVYLGNPDDSFDALAMGTRENHI